MFKHQTVDMTLNMLEIQHTEDNEKMTTWSYRSLNEHGSLVPHLAYNIWEADRLVCFYQTHRSLHCYQNARSTDASAAKKTNKWNHTRQHIQLQIANRISFSHFSVPEKKTFLYYLAEKDIRIFISFLFSVLKWPEKKSVLRLSQCMAGRTLESPAVAYSRCLHRHPQRQ